ncbi:DUF3857 domain-containing protein [Hyphobacterium sp.]|uniref:DUF3857 domain-containing protein n=1 Tax=Hyphobacterium sp. TaxID=2004662 RepID=UPI003749F5EA
MKIAFGSGRLWLIAAFLLCSVSTASALQSGRLPGGLPDVPRTTTRQIEPDVRFAPTPAFVREVAPLGPERYEDDPVGEGQVLLIDQQYDGRGETLIQYFRLVARGTSQPAAGAISQFQLPMDPALSSLEIHHARFIRDGRTIDMTRDVSVDFLRQEEALSQGLFTGRVNALVRIPGARAEDVIDIAYSLHHRNEAVGNRHSLMARFDFAETVDHFHFRALWPAEELREREFGPPLSFQRRVYGNDVEFTYGPAELVATKTELLVPPWRFTQPTVILTRFESWADLAGWAAPLYQPRITASVRDVADTIRRDHLSAEDQIAAALRYVQREINYFAILLGDGGYVPLSPEDTLRYSEGDCKAKTLLLLSILAALGIDADAALVSVSMGPGLLELPATPILFDHVIVTLTQGGQRYWLDPTSPEQFGSLRSLTPADYGYALVLDSQTRGLMDMSLPDRPPMLVVTENIDLISLADSRAEMTLEWVFSGEAADQMRMAHDHLGNDVALQQFSDFYSQRFDERLDFANGDIVDDRENNQFIFRWSGLVRLINYVNSRRRPVFALAAHAPTMGIFLAPTEQREHPLILPHGYHARQETRLTWPEHADFLTTEPHDNRIQAPEFLIETRVVAGEHSATLTAETHVSGYEFDTDALEPVAGALQQITPYDRLMIVGTERNVTGRRRDESINPQEAMRLTVGTFLPAITEVRR